MKFACWLGIRHRNREEKMQFDITEIWELILLQLPCDGLLALTIHADRALAQMQLASRYLLVAFRFETKLTS